MHSRSTKTSFKEGGESPYCTLYVSVARVLLFLWCIVTESSLSRKSCKDDDLSLYAILNALSCKRVILLLLFRLWDVQTKGQYQIEIL